MSIRSSISISLLAVVLLASCTSTQPVAQHGDDVYYLPSQAKAKAAPPAPQPEEAAVAPQTDDYYDAGTSQDLGTNQNYYDMAYNDPYYYNYGRFGFNSAPMGWQTGWNGPGWGMGFGAGLMGLGYGSGYFGSGWGMSLGYGWGYGSGVYSGWWRPTYSLGYGYGWGNSWGYGYNPYGWYNDPFMYGYGGYGWGNYWGPFGRCGYYYPVSVGNVVVAHRGGLTHVGANGSSDVRQPRMAVRNPVSLQPAVNHRNASDTNRGTLRQPSRSTAQPTYRPGTVNREPARQQPVITRSSGNDRPARGTFESRPSFDRGGGGSMPSRGGGGGGSAPVRRAR